VTGPEGLLDELGEALASVLGREHVLTDPSLTRTFEEDWLGRYAGPSRAVVRPADTAQVAGVLAVCREAGVAVVPQGGNTGLVGGGVPHHGEVVLSTRRLVHGFELDPVSGHASLPAGMTVAEAQARLRAAGRELGIDLASRDSATAGGLVATNAGGLRVPRFGHVREQLVGIEAVLADGTVVQQMAGLLKDNSGYHLTGLLCGSEGTLGVVTRVRLRTWPVARQRVTVLLAVDDLASCAQVLRAVACPELESAEVVFADGVEHAVALGARRALREPAPCELLLELADRRHAGPDLLAALADRLADTAAAEVLVCTDEAGRRGLWDRRERHPEVVTRLPGVPLKLDTAVPLDLLPAYERAVRAAVAAADSDAVTVLYGHVMDGNLHVNVAAAPERAADVRQAVIGAVRAHRGSISAEHGIGRDKRDDLHHVRSGGEIAVMRALKRALDPQAILNPNVLLPRA
jgi:FAD/FMN-containing dehydrogenase